MVTQNSLRPNFKLHFVGIGGSGMAPLAEYCHRLGCVVSGSDVRSNEMTQRLANLGISILTKHMPENISAELDAVVFSSAIEAENPELTRAKGLCKTLWHRSDLLNLLMEGKKSICVAGTHGKTTTTAMIAHVLAELQLDPSAIVGGIMNDKNSAMRFGRSEFFVAEADESDGSFLKYAPFISVINNIDLDHLNYFQNMSNMQTMFLQYLGNTQQDGAAVVGWNDANVRNLLQDQTLNRLSFGTVLGAEVRAYAIKYEAATTRFTAIVEHDQIPCEIPAIGEHNVLNALATLSVIRALGLDCRAAARALGYFKGVKRRLDLIYQDSLCYVYDDYAHNPGKIGSCLAALRTSHPNRQLNVVFQPHRFTRLATSFVETAEALGLADQIFVLPVYAAGEAASSEFNSETLVDLITSRIRKPVFFIEDPSATTQFFLKHRELPALIVTLGAGDVWKQAQNIRSSLISPPQQSRP